MFKKGGFIYDKYSLINSKNRDNNIYPDNISDLEDKKNSNIIQQNLYLHNNLEYILNNEEKIYIYIYNTHKKICKKISDTNIIVEKIIDELCKFINKEHPSFDILNEFIYYIYNNLYVIYYLDKYNIDFNILFKEGSDIFKNEKTIEYIINEALELKIQDMETGKKILEKALSDTDKDKEIKKYEKISKDIKDIDNLIKNPTKIYINKIQAILNFLINILNEYISDDIDFNIKNIISTCIAKKIINNHKTKIDLKNEYGFNLLEKYILAKAENNNSDIILAKAENNNSDIILYKNLIYDKIQDILNKNNKIIKKKDNPISNLLKDRFEIINRYNIEPPFKSYIDYLHELSNEFILIDNENNILYNTENIHSKPYKIYQLQNSLKIIEINNNINLDIHKGNYFLDRFTLKLIKFDDSYKYKKQYEIALQCLAYFFNLNVLKLESVFKNNLKRADLINDFFNIPVIIINKKDNILNSFILGGKLLEFINMIETGIINNEIVEDIAHLHNHFNIYRGISLNYPNNEHAKIINRNYNDTLKYIKDKLLEYHNIHKDNMDLFILYTLMRLAENDEKFPINYKKMYKQLAQVIKGDTISDQNFYYQNIKENEWYQELYAVIFSQQTIDVYDKSYMNCGENTLLNMLFYLLSNKNYDYTNKNNEIGIQKEIHEYMLKNNYTTFEINKEQSYFGKLIPDLDMKLNKQKNKGLYARQCANNTMGCEIIPSFKNFIYIFENIIIPNIQNDEEYKKINTDDDKFTYIVSKFNKDIKITISGDINNITIKLVHFVNITFDLEPSHGTTNIINKNLSNINIYIDRNLDPRAYENSLENELMIEHKLKTSSGKIIDRKHYKPQYFDRFLFRKYHPLEFIEYLTKNKIIALYIDYGTWLITYYDLIEKILRLQNKRPPPENIKLIKDIVENIKELNNELYKQLLSTTFIAIEEFFAFIYYYLVYDIEILENNIDLIKNNIHKLHVLYDIYHKLNATDIFVEFIKKNNIEFNIPNTQQKYKNKYIKYKMKYLALKNNI
jgi:hypothetical protein